MVNVPMEQTHSEQQVSAQGRQLQPTSPEEVAETLRGYAHEGLSHVQLWLTPNTVKSLDWFEAVLDLLDQGGA